MYSCPFFVCVQQRTNKVTKGLNRLMCFVLCDCETQNFTNLKTVALLVGTIDIGGNQFVFYVHKQTNINIVIKDN